MMKKPVYGAGLGAFSWIILQFFIYLPHKLLTLNTMAAKSDVKKKRSPEIEIVWKDNVPEATYFNRNGYSIVAKVENGQFIMTRDGWDDDPEKKDIVTVSQLYTAKLKESLKVKQSDSLLKALGKRFALKEPHNSFVKILISLERRGIRFVREFK